MSLDKAVRAIARKAIHATGQSATIRRVTVGTYNPATRSVTNAVADQTIVGRLDEYSLREFNNTVQVGDQKFIIAATDLSWVPAPKDRAIVGSTDYDIVTVRQDTAAAQAAFYTLQLRR